MEKQRQRYNLIPHKLAYDKQILTYIRQPCVFTRKCCFCSLGTNATLFHTAQQNLKDALKRLERFLTGKKKNLFSFEYLHFERATFHYSVMSDILLGETIDGKLFGLGASFTRVLFCVRVCGGGSVMLRQDIGLVLLMKVL